MSGWHPVKIIIPKRLPSWNLMWAGLHHRERTRLKNEWHILTLSVLPGDMALFTEPVIIRATTYAARNPIDPSNLCLKPVEDALIDHLLMDDSYKFVDEVRLRSRKCKTEAEERTEIEIWEVASA